MAVVNAVFILLLVILGYGLVRRPGMVLAYVLLFQGLNSFLFNQLELGALRYLTTLVLYPLVLLLHRGTPRLGQLSAAAVRNKGLQGYVLITGYVFLSALAAGTSHEINFFVSFVFPGALLYFIASTTVFSTRALWDITIGIVVFSFLTISALVSANQGISGFFLGRADIGAATGMGIITQGRTAGLFALVAGVLTLHVRGARKALTALLTCIAITWLFLAGSRGPAAALLLTVVLYVALARRRPEVLIYGLLLGGILAGLYFWLDLGQTPLAVRTMLLLGDVSALQSTQRYNRWLIFFELLPQHFMFGLGPGGWGKYVWFVPESYPHSIIIEFVLDYGLVGLLSLVLIVGAGSALALRILRSEMSELPERIIVLCWVFYFLCTLVSGGMVYGNQAFFTLSGLMASLSVRTARRERRHTAPAPATGGVLDALRQRGRVEASPVQIDAV